MPTFDDIPVRDALAAERTLVAAERTFLAYVRTAFAMFVTGISGAELIEHGVLNAVGYALAGLSALVFAASVVRYRRAQRDVASMVARLGAED